MWFSKNLEWDDMLTLIFKGQGQILRFHVTNFSLKRFLHLCSVVPSCSTLMSKLPFLILSKGALGICEVLVWGQRQSLSTTGLDPVLRTQFGATLVQLLNSWSSLTLCLGLVPCHPFASPATSCCLCCSTQNHLLLCSFLTENYFLEVSCFSQSDCFLGSFYPSQGSWIFLY